MLDWWLVPLPFTKALSLNDRMNHWVKAKAVREWRDAARWSARAARIPASSRIRVGFHYIPKDRRRRDSDNLVGAFKPCVDALVDEGVVPDDTLQYVEREWPMIHDPDPSIVGGRFWLSVALLEETTATA